MSGDISIITRPAGAYRMRTYLEDNGYSIEVIDYFHSFSDDSLHEVLEKYITEKTLFVGLSATFLLVTTEDRALKVIRLMQWIREKYPHVKIVVGGNETKLSIHKLTKSIVDAIIWGFSEKAMLHYLDHLSGKRPDPVQFVDYLGFDVLDGESGNYKNDTSNLTIKWKESDMIALNYLPMEISRGCIFKCSFCSFPLLGKKKNDYIRDTSNLADEIKENYERWGVNNYIFMDDTFNDNIYKIEQVLEAVRISGVKITYGVFMRADLMAIFPETIPMLVESGLKTAIFGFETLHPVAKKAIGKGYDSDKQFEAIIDLKSRADIFTSSGFIVGLPGEPVESIYQTDEFLWKNKGKILDSWGWWSLSIKKSAFTRKSAFEKDYQKWGYTIVGPGDRNWEQAQKNAIESPYELIWKNEHMDWIDSMKIAGELNSKLPMRSHDGAGLSAWDITELMGLGIPIKELIDEQKNHNRFVNPATAKPLIAKAVSIIKDYITSKTI